MDTIKKTIPIPAAVLAASLLFFLSSLRACGDAAPDNFSQAKSVLERIYADHRLTVYCGAAFDAQKHVALPDGFATPSHAKRAARVEWEHAVPVENFGRAFEVWREGDPQCVDSKGKPYRGRRCAEKTSAEFRRMEADMHNFFPAIGAVNAVRGKKRYDALPDDAPTFGTCPAKYAKDAFEPPDDAKGRVARAALYMADAYARRYRLSDRQRRLFEAWDRMFPVDDWECTRARRIEEAGGDENSHVKRPCQKKGLW